MVLSGCGGGWGSSSSSPSQQNVAPSTPTVTAYNNVMYIYLDDYADEDSRNIPYVYVYINGGSTPIPLLLDTGATGILINKSALTAAGVDIASTSKTFSVTFGDNSTASGYVNDADVYTASSGGGLEAQNIPIAIATSDNAFPSTGFLQGISAWDYLLAILSDRAEGRFTLRHFLRQFQIATIATAYIKFSKYNLYKRI